MLFLSGYFLTKVFHPNVSESGEICVNTLKRDWKPDLGIKHILLVRIHLIFLSIIINYRISSKYALVTLANC